MKICYIGSVFPRNENDSEVPWLKKTITHLRNSGHDIRVYVPSFRGLPSHSIEGIPVKRFRYFFAPWEDVTHDEGAPNKIHKFHYKVITIFYILFGTFGLIKYHFKEKFDIIHIHWPFPHGILGFAAKFFCNTNIILNFHGASLLLVHKYGFVKHFLGYFIKNADQVIVNSSFTGGKVKGIYDRSIHIIPYGTTVTPKNREKTKRKKHSILSVGRLIERKGFPYLVEAMPEILKHFPDTGLTIAGSGPARAELLKIIENRNLHASVSLPGRVTQQELENLYASSELFILPSIIDSKGDTEGLGVVLIEAISYGLPVIASDAGGITDIAVNEKTALVVRQKDPEAIARAVNRLFSDENLKKNICIEAMSHIDNNFSWPSVINKLNQIYSTLK